MIYSVGIPLLLVHFYYLYRILNNRQEEINFRFRLHRLQRRLHNLAENNYVNPGSREFDYLDATLFLLVENSRRFTLFNLLVWEFRHRRIKKDIKLYRKLYSSALKKIEANLYLYDIHEARIRICIDYILGRNRITWFLLRNLHPYFLNIHELKHSLRNRVVGAGYYPETSAIRKFLVVVAKFPGEITPAI